MVTEYCPRIFTSTVLYSCTNDYDDYETGAPTEAEP